MLELENVCASAVFSRVWKTFVLLVATLTVGSLQAETNPRYYTVEVSATVEAQPPKITLNWPADQNASGYTVYRKAPADTSWGNGTALGGSAVSYVDSSVSLGSVFEYQIVKQTGAGYSGYGYVLAGVNAPLVETRGKVVLVVDKTHASDLAMELDRLRQDLIGDGWEVIRVDVSPSDSVPSVKARIKAEYDKDSAKVKAVFLFGRVPVPYSGNFNPDGHPDHRGAWPADLYYGDMDGNWTDSSVNTTSAERPRNHNVPGDGKFDQVELPSDVELHVGRVDMANMTCFANKSPARSEKDLLRQYLNKDHDFRHRIFTAERRGLVCDNFGEKDGEAFAASGWRNFAPFFGSANVRQVDGWQYFPAVSSESYLWSYGNGGGSWYTCDGIGSSDDFAKNEIKTVFTMFLGSYFGDWDNESNFLRAPLGSGYCLTTSWAGRPHWFYHHMGLGETIGYAAKLSQNNGSSGLYRALNYGARWVHVALLGDPTLRMHPVIPPSDLRSAAAAGGVTLTWNPSTDTDLVGYHVYRSGSTNGPFTRATGETPVKETTFTDNGTGSNSVYMVRAVKLERSGSGTYYNPSQGIFLGAGSGATGGTNSPSGLSAPYGLAATQVESGQINLSWQTATNSGGTGFRIERKDGETGAYQSITNVSANVTSYVDKGVTNGATYYYRVAALGPSGDSPPSAEVRTAVSAGSAGGKAAVRFIGVDSSTRGNWKGVYGQDGYHIIAESTANYPAYAVVSRNGNDTYIWQSSTSDPRALQKSTGNDRIASAWYANQSFEIDVNFTDGNAHAMSIYFLDWDTNQRVQTVDVLDATTSTNLHTQTLQTFSGGQYLSWEIQGHVKIRVTHQNGNNAVAMGLFFGPASSPTGNDSSATLSVGKDAAAGVLAKKFPLRIAGKEGQKFEVQVSSDMVQWTTIDTVTMSGSETTYSDASATDSARFYRVVPVQ